MNITDKLYDILSHSVDWVKYAESKNGALLVLNSFIFIRLLSFQIDESPVGRMFFIASVFFLFISILLLCVAFIPIVNYKKIILNMNKQDDLSVENMYDFLVRKEDLRISPKNFLRFYYQSHNSDFDQHLPIERLCSEQIYIQKYMRFRKFKYFNISLLFTMFGFLCLLVFGFLKILN